MTQELQPTAITVDDDFGDTVPIGLISMSLTREDVYSLVLEVLHVLGGYLPRR